MDETEIGFPISHCPQKKFNSTQSKKLNNRGLWEEYIDENKFI